MRPRADCGTDSGHRRHIRLGERPCTPCCDAYNAAKTRRRRAAGPVNPLQYRAARLGAEPAEALTQRDRHRLVAELHRAGWTDVQIAQHTRMTTYTTGRIRAHLGLPALDRPVHGQNRRTA